jgi:hypothetical protein
MRPVSPELLVDSDPSWSPGGRALTNCPSHSVSESAAAAASRSSRCAVRDKQLQVSGSVLRHWHLSFARSDSGLALSDLGYVVLAAAHWQTGPVSAGVAGFKPSSVTLRSRNTGKLPVCGSIHLKLCYSGSQSVGHVSGAVTCRREKVFWPPPRSDSEPVTEGPMPVMVTRTRA